MSMTEQIPITSPIGRDTPRVDGPLKVSGKAKYTSDFHFPGLLYAVPVEATIANGRVVKLDTVVAAKMPGVRAIFHRENIGKIFRSTPGHKGTCDERRPPFADDVVRYYGQYIALAVADTFEAAKAAADAVRVAYSKDKPNVETDLKADDDPDVVATTFGIRHRLDSQRGDAEAAFATAPVKLDETYVTPTETHNPLELHATTAVCVVDIDRRVRQRFAKAPNHVGDRQLLVVARQEDGDRRFGGGVHRRMSPGEGEGSRQRSRRASRFTIY